MPTLPVLTMRLHVRSATPAGMCAGVGLSMWPTISYRSSESAASVVLVKWKPVRMTGRSSHGCSPNTRRMACVNRVTCIHAAKNRLGKERNAVQGAPHQSAFLRLQPTQALHENRHSQRTSAARDPRGRDPRDRQETEGAGRGEITIEAGAGTAAAYTDQAYTDAGANDRAGCRVGGRGGRHRLQDPAADVGDEGVDEIGLLRRARC